MKNERENEKETETTVEEKIRDITLARDIFLESAAERLAKGLITKEEHDRLAERINEGYLRDIERAWVA